MPEALMDPLNRLGENQPTGTHVFQRPPGLASLADLAAAAVLLGLGLDQMTLRLRRYLLSLRKRQPNHPRRIFGDGRTAAKFVSRDRPVSWTNFNSNITRHLIPHSSLSPWSRNVHPQVLDGPLWHVANVLRTQVRVERVMHRRVGISQPSGEARASTMQSFAHQLPFPVLSVVAQQEVAVPPHHR
jgi:hypothetical protein